MKDALQKIAKNYNNSMKKNPVNHELATKNKRIEELEEELANCEDYITNQVQEMKKVAFFIERLVQTPRRNDGCHCNRIKQLQTRVNKYKKKLAKNEENHKALLEKFESEKRSKTKTEEAFVRMAKIYEDLVKRDRDYETLQCQCEKYKEEKQQLTATLEETKNLVLDLEAHIAECEQEIEDTQNEFRYFSNERTCMCKHLQELTAQIEDHKSKMTLKDNNNKVLLQTLDKQKVEKARLEVAFDVLTRSDEHSKEMLQQARHTIKFITQKLEEYDIERLETQRDHQIKITELEGQLVVAKATINKLRGNLDEMKGIMDKNVALRTLSAQLHEAANIQVTQLQDANEDLSTRSQKMAEMYNYLKQVLFEKDKTFEDLRNRLLALRQQLDNEQKLREDTEAVLADMAASGDSALAQLHDVINAQSEEIDRLHMELEELMSTTPVGMLRSQIQQLERENSHLRNEVQKFAAYVRAILPGYIKPDELSKLKSDLGRLTREVETLKHEIENQKNMRVETVMRLKSQMDLQEEHYRKIKELTRENEELKRKSPPSGAVIVLEREGDEYRYLYGMHNDKGAEEVKTKPFDETERVRKKRDTSERAELLNQIEAQKKEIADLLKKIEKNALPSDTTRENERLKSMIADLQNQLRNAPKVKDSNELENYVTQLQSCENRSEKLKLKNAGLEREVAELEEEIRDLKKKTELPPASQTYLKQIQDLGGTLDHWKDDITAAINDLRNQAQASTLNNNDIQKLMEKLDHMEKETMDALVNKKKVLVTNDLQDKHIAELENQLRKSQEDNDEMRENLRTLQKAMDTIMDDMVLELPKQPSSADIKQAHDDKVNQLELKLHDYERQNEHLKSELETLRDQKGSVLPSDETQIDKDKRLKELEALLKQWQKDYDTEVGKLRQEMEKYRDSAGSHGCPGHEAIIRNLEAALENAIKQNESLDKKNVKLENEIDRLTKELDGYRDDATVAGSVAGEAGQQKRELVEHLRSLEKKNEGLQTKTIQLEIENERLKNDLERLVGPDYSKVEKELQRLRDLERQIARFEDKYQKLKKRLMKVEIENKNLKKEYIDTLIAREKISLHNLEQERRLREMNKLLRKTQDKKYSLTTRIIKLQVENDDMKIQLDSLVGKELEENLQRHEDSFKPLKQRIAEVEAENEYLREVLQDKISDNQLEEIPQLDVEKHLKKNKENEDLKQKIIHLEIENEYMKKELEGMKGGLPQLGEDSRKVENEDLQLKAYELLIENEFLKNELTNKDKMNLESGVAEKQVSELEEQVQKLIENNEKLKMKNLEMELENEYMKKELDRVDAVQEALITDVSDKKWEKQTHALKLKIDNLEIENRNLRSQLAEIGKKQISLETHTQHKLLREIEKLVREFDTVKNATSKQENSVAGIEDVAERMRQWREQYEPQLQELKEDLGKLAARGKRSSLLLENQVQDYKGQVEKLEAENMQMKVALEVLLKEKKSFNNVRLVEEVDKLLQKYKEEEAEMKSSRVDIRKFKDLEVQLKECQAVNELLRNEKVSLESHNQDQKIRDLEDQIREYGLHNPSQQDRQSGRQNIAIDVQLMRLKEMEETNQELNRSNAALELELEKLRIEKVSLESKIKECQDTNEELKTEIERARKVNEFQQTLTADLNKQLQECRNEKEELLAKANERLVSFQEPEGDENNLRKELAKLSKAYEEQKYQIANLEERLKKCREINKNLKNDMVRLQGEGPSNEQQQKGQKEQRDESPSKSQDDSKENKAKEQEEERDESPSKSQEDSKEKENEAKDEEVYVKRVKQLELRLIQSHSNYRRLNTELEALRRDKLLVQYKRFERKSNILEKQLQESREWNAELQRLLVSKEAVEEENRGLKHEVNKLKHSLIELHKMQPPGSGESPANATVLENKKEETQNTELSLVIANLSEQIIGAAKLRLEVGEGDADDKRLRKLEQTLLKYHDNNESLRVKISQLEDERAKLKGELGTYLDKEKKLLQSEAQAKQIRKLEETLQKYQDNNFKLRAKLARLCPEKLEIQVEKYQINNEDLNAVATQIRSDIKYVKQELQGFLEREKKREEKKSESTHKQVRAVVPKVEMVNQYTAAMGVQPVLWQYVMTQNQADKDLENFSSLVERIQKTLDKSRRVLELELSNKCENEEKEVNLVDFESYNSLKVDELNKKQLETKEKICKLQSTIRDTMKVVKDESQKYLSLKVEPDPLPVHSGTISPEFGHHQITYVKSQNSNSSSGSAFFIPHFHAGPSLVTTDSENQPSKSQSKRKSKASDADEK